MRKFSEKTIAKVRSAKRKLKRRLERRVKPIEGIVGYGIGYREREGKLVNRCVIRVYVRRKFSKALLPKNQRIPESVDGIPVDVIEDDGFPEAGGVPTDRHMPLTGGIQIANLTFSRNSELLVAVFAR